MEILEPRQPTYEQWQLLLHSINFLFILVAMAVNGAMSMLLAHAVIPSLVMNHEAPPSIMGFRRILYPIFFASFLCALYALGRAMATAIPVLQQIYPRFAF